MIFFIFYDYSRKIDKLKYLETFAKGYLLLLFLHTEADNNQDRLYILKKDSEPVGVIFPRFFAPFAK